MTDFFDKIRSGNINQVKREKNFEYTDIGGNNGLHIAVQFSNLRMVKFLVGKGIDINKKNEMQVTPLHKAINFSSIEVLRYLVKAGAKIDQPAINMANVVKDKEKITFLLSSSKNLIYAIKAENVMAIKNHVDKESFDFNCFSLAMKSKNKEINALVKEHVKPEFIFDAIELDNVEATKYLIEYGLNQSVLDKSGKSPILRAVAENCDIKIIEMLINAGADVNDKSNISKTVLFEAINNQNAKVAKILLENGAHFHERYVKQCIETSRSTCKSGHELKLFKKKPWGYESNCNGVICDVCNNNFERSNIEIFGCRTCRWDMCKYCMKNLAKFYMLETILPFTEKCKYITSELVMPYIKADETDKVEFLIKYMTNVNQMHNGDNLLHCAIKHSKKLKFLKMLVEKGVNVNVRNKKGCTPLDMAIESYDKTMITYFIDKGAYIDSDKKSNVDFALEMINEKNSNMVILLIKAGLNENMHFTIGDDCRCSGNQCLCKGISYDSILGWARAKGLDKLKEFLS